MHPPGHARGQLFVLLALAGEMPGERGNAAEHHPGVRLVIDVPDRIERAEGQGVGIVDNEAAALVGQFMFQSFHQRPRIAVVAHLQRIAQFLLHADRAEPGPGRHHENRRIVFDGLFDRRRLAGPGAGQHRAHAAEFVRVFNGSEHRLRGFRFDEGDREQSAFVFRFFSFDILLEQFRHPVHVALIGAFQKIRDHGGAHPNRPGDERLRERPPGGLAPIHQIQHALQHDFILRRHQSHQFTSA